MRVAHITRCLDVGGQEKLLVEFARHADRERFALHFVSLTTRGRLAETLEDCGWPVTALEEPEGLLPGLVWRLARFFRANAFEVVHTHDEKPLMYGAPAATLAGVPAVLHTQHHGPLPTIKRRHTIITALAARLTNRFVCVSRASARWLVREGAPAGKVTTLHNGIDLERFAAAGPCLDGPAVTVARLSPEKDQATLLEAVALARKVAPALTLEIAGDGPCRNALTAQAAALNLNGAVRFLGEVSDVPAVLARASLFVLSSVTEGISLTLLEAMARGLPVLATAVGGNPEVVAAGETGRLVPASSPAALADALVEMMRDPAELRRLGQAGRRRAETHFDIRRMVGHYEAMYEAALAGGRCN